MPIETDLNRSPYFDDYQETKDFYKILFQPSVSVQVRELNQLQSILQKQIERFGDNIFKRGTLVDGCNFGFLNPYPYVKLVDNETNGTPAAISTYKGLFATEEVSGLKAFIVNYQEGFETSDPDLNTLYVQYINSGDDYQTTAFTAGRTLTIADAKTSIFRVATNNGGVAFANSDTLIVSPALIINVTTGTISNGTYLNNGVANVQIIEVDETTLEDSNQIIVRVKPRDTDLANATINATAWTIANSDNLTNPAATIAATVEGIIGSGLTGTILTDGVGTITDVIVVNTGQEYSTLPVVRVKSANNTTGLADLDLSAENYLAKIKSSTKAGTVGNGYAFSVTGGVIYQKGFFLRAAPQTVIVEKYSQTPNNVVVGFNTTEQIITSSIDTTLLDNALEEENQNAPGADRLKLVPTLEVMTVDASNANDQFFPLVQWSEGNPFKQNQYTSYNKINDQMAERLFDESGNFSIDRFNVTTRTPESQNAQGEYVSVVVDPGIAYISGYKVRTNHNFVIDIKKGTDTNTSALRRISVNYGNYIRAKELGGVFQFSTGDTIKLYDTAKQFITNTSAAAVGNTTAVGTQIGTARIRSLIHEDGTAGTANCVYRMYMFDVNMNAGQSFRNAKSVVYDGTKKGIADIVLELDATTAANIAVLKESDKSKLLFSAGVSSLKNANQVTYQYRTIDQTVAVSNNGIMIKDISAITNEFFPYSGTLTDNQLKQIYVVPDISFQAANDATGNISCTTTSANITGSGTLFITELAVGDFINVYSNATAGGEVRRIVSIANNTQLTVDANVSFANTSGNLRRYFPKYVPVPFGTRDGLTANVDANNNILTLNFGTNIDSATTSNCALAVNIERTNIDQTTKSASRSQFVKIQLSNNAANTVGPWCLGVADVFRLRNVYLGSNSTVANTDVSVVNDFYIDHNQNLNYYNQSFLYKRPDSRLTLASTNFLLVEFDYFTSSGAGFYDTVSYVSANAEQIFLVDSQPLSNLSSTINTLEIPTIYTNRGEKYDLKGQFDFRPTVNASATPSAVHGTAPINPAINVYFGNTANPANDKKFPLPDQTLECQIESWVGRNDSVIIDKDGQVSVLKGTSTKTPDAPYNAMLLDVLTIPPYPNLPRRTSANTNAITLTRLANEIYLSQIRDRLITQSNTSNIITKQQPGRFTKSNLAQLERRVRNLEYYVSLTLLESDITNRIIPSSLDPSLNRFKYGFFADEFENLLYSDTQNPQYASALERISTRSCITPTRFTWPIYGPANDGYPPYVDYVVVSQLNATLTGLQPNCVPNTAYGYLYTVRKHFSDIEVGNTASGYADTYANLMFSNTSAPATLYFDTGNAPSKIEVYQGNTLLLTSNDAQILTATDKSLITSNSIPAGWFLGSNLDIATTVVGNNYVKNAGKITWTHNPSGGRSYSIVVTKGTSAREWRYAVQIPVDANTYGCEFNPTDDPTGNTPTGNTPSPPTFRGTMDVSPGIIQYLPIPIIINAGDGNSY